MALSSTDLKSLVFSVAQYAGYKDDWIQEVFDTRGIHYLIKQVSSELWLKQLPDSPECQALRDQVNFLNAYGVFDLIPEE